MTSSRSQMRFTSDSENRPSGPEGGQIGEGRVMEAGRIQHTAAGECIDDLVDELDLGAVVGVFDEELSDQPSLAAMQSRPIRERMEIKSRCMVR